MCIKILICLRIGKAFCFADFYYVNLGVLAIANKDSKELQINEEIRDKEIRVI